MFWNHPAPGTTFSIDNTPFQIGYKHDLECQYGNHYYKNKRKDPEVITAEKNPRIRSRGTRKQGCKACINIREYILYPHYSIDSSVASTLLKWKLRKLKEEKLSLFKVDIEQGIAKSTHKYYVSLPTVKLII